jgi:hypothetical protein
MKSSFSPSAGDSKFLEREKLRSRLHDLFFIMSAFLEILVQHNLCRRTMFMAMGLIFSE